MNGSPVAGLVRGWVDLYTRGLPADRATHAATRSPTTCGANRTEAAAAGRSARSLDADLFRRLVFGMPADVSWRLAYRRAPTAASLARSSWMSTRALGTLAIMYGLGFRSCWSYMPRLGRRLCWSTFGFFAVPYCDGDVAFPAAALGLARRLRIAVGMLGASARCWRRLGSLRPVPTRTGRGSPRPRSVGSAMLMWDLAGIGVVSRVGDPDRPGAEPRSDTRSRFVLAPPAAGLFIPFLLSWVAIGVSLIRGVPQAQARSG